MRTIEVIFNKPFGQSLVEESGFRCEITYLCKLNPRTDHSFFVVLEALWLGFCCPKTWLSANIEQGLSAFTPIVRGLPV